MENGKELLELNDSNFDKVIVNSGSASLVDFWAPWCGPCKMLSPVLEEVAREISGKVVVGKVNVDENPVVSGRYKIMSIPTMLVFKNGKIVDQIMVAQPKENILKRVISATNL